MIYTTPILVGTKSAMACYLKHLQYILKLIGQLLALSRLGNGQWLEIY